MRHGLISVAPFESGFLPNISHSFIAPVLRWSSYDAAEGAPDVAFVEPMLRRRLSSLAKMVLRVAQDCASDLSDVRVVFASRHGELSRTTAMLESLAVGEPLSPTSFGMSVLNASVGLLSILWKNTAPGTAISAGDASFGYGLMEAALQSAEHPEQAVLLIYADEPVPSVYDDDDGTGAIGHALGVLLQSTASQRIECVSTFDAGLADAERQAVSFVRSLESGQSEWRGNGRVWRWTRVE